MRSLETTCCILEPVVATHAEEMFSVLSDPAIYEFENEPPPSVEWLAARYQRLENRRSPDGTELWLNWVIRLPAAGLVGFVQATIMKSRGLAFIAYVLHSRFWGQGIGRHAVESMLADLVARYGVCEFAAVMKSSNRRSLALTRSLGFREAPPQQSKELAVEPDELAMILDAANFHLPVEDHP